MEYLNVTRSHPFGEVSEVILRFVGMQRKTNENRNPQGSSNESRVSYGPRTFTEDSLYSSESHGNTNFWYDKIPGGSCKQRIKSLYGWVRYTTLSSKKLGSIVLTTEILSRRVCTKGLYGLLLNGPLTKFSCLRARDWVNYGKTVKGNFLLEIMFFTPLLRQLDT